MKKSMLVVAAALMVAGIANAQGGKSTAPPTGAATAPTGTSMEGDMDAHMEGQVPPTTAETTPGKKDMKKKVKSTKKTSSIETEVDQGSSQTH